MTKAIVTGATGFVGSHLVEELLEKGIEVILLVRDPDKLIPVIRNNSQVHIVSSSINSAYELMSEFSDIDVFYHLAWGGVSTENKNDIQLQLSNIKMATDALELCNKLGCRQFVVAGTVAEYVFTNDIIDMNAQQTPNDMYGAAKVSAHYFVDVYARSLGQSYIWAVLPSTFGERRSDNNIITYTINSLLKGESPKYGNLLQMWDFLYVKEVAKALVAIGEKGKSGKIYGIGSGKFRLLRDYVTSIRDIINPDIELQIGAIPELSEQTFSSCANIYNLVKDTGYMPGISFEEGIERTIPYYKERLLKDEG